MPAYLLKTYQSENPSIPPSAIHNIQARDLADATQQAGSLLGAGDKRITIDEVVPSKPFTLGESELGGPDTLGG